MNLFILRLLDYIFALAGLVILSPVILIVTCIGYFDTGSPFLLQRRLGIKKQQFTLIKFRTMSLGTETVASHLVNSLSITKFGKILRKTKIDELPQLINILQGNMSLVGPRPNLPNQNELISERESRGVYDVLPGITGLAQIQTIDMSTPKLLAVTDQKMIQTMTVNAYFMYIFMTVLGRGAGDRAN